MPERTSDGKWKWGNIKKNSRKELAQTVYGIWKGSGSKGSFHNFYHYGNGYRTSKKNKMKKENYQMNPLLILKESVLLKNHPIKKTYTLEDISDLIRDTDKKKFEVYWGLRCLRVKMRKTATKEVPKEVVLKILNNKTSEHI